MEGTSARGTLLIFFNELFGYCIDYDVDKSGVWRGAREYLSDGMDLSWCGPRGLITSFSPEKKKNNWRRTFVDTMITSSKTYCVYIYIINYILLIF